ncbi:MAG: hypothetical protein IJW46_05735 [Clostridia bacterium]|nr:hypothetical protein [Clostridia bacterium]
MKHKTLALYSYIGALVASLLVAVVHTVTYLNHYDFTASLWQHGVSGMIGMLSYLCLIPILTVAAVYGITLKKAEEEEGSSASLYIQSRFSKIASLAVAVLLALTLVAQALAVGTSDRLHALVDPTSGAYMSLTSMLHILTLVFALPAAWYFVSLFRKKEAPLSAGLLVLGYFILYTLRVYFDMSMHINNPRWSFRVMVLAAILLYFVLELRHSLKPERHLAYVLFGFLALSLSLTEALSEIVYAIGFYTNDGFELTYSVMKLSIAVYIASRLWDLTRSLDKKLPEGVSESGDPKPSDTPDAVTALPEDTPKTLEGFEDTPKDTGDTVEDTSEESLPEALLQDLTKEELMRFYRALYQSLAKKQGVNETSPEEDRQRVREETMTLIAKLLDGDSREEGIRYMRALLRRMEDETE